MNPLKKTVGKALVVSVFVFLFVFSAPLKASAQWPTWDLFTGPGMWTTTAFQGSQFAKEFVGDSIANFVVKTIIQRLTAQTVNWINSGFKGNPAFVTDPEKFFLNAGDEIAAHYLSMQGPLNQLCSPFQAQVRIAIAQNYLQETNKNKYSCTLGRIADNYESFMKNFDNGGWASWINISQNSQSNPYGAYLDYKNSLGVQVGNTQNKYQKQLDWGKGVLSYERCKSGTTSSKVLDGNGNITGIAELGECKKWEDLKSVPISPITGAPTRDRKCLEYAKSDMVDVDTGIGVGDCAPGDKETVTPGSLINDQMTKALGSTWASLEASDEINEIVGALMQQLVTKVVGGIGSGLRGLSSKESSTNNSKTFIEQIVSSTASTSKETGDFTKGMNKGVPSDLCKPDPNFPDSCSEAAPPIPPIPSQPGSSSTNKNLSDMTDNELLDQWRSLEDQKRDLPEGSDVIADFNTRIDRIKNEFVNRTRCPSLTVCTLEYAESAVAISGSSNP